MLDSFDRPGLGYRSPRSELAPRFHPATGRPVGSWEVVPDAVAAADIVDLSAAYESAAATLETEMSRYGGVEWTATHTYCDEGKAPSPATANLLGPVFEPLIAAVQLQLEGRCECQLKLESAFATLYSTYSNTGMADHRDFDSAGRLVACSAILQGHTPAGFEGGGLWMRAGNDTEGDGRSAPEDNCGRILVHLDPGTLMLLFGAWHEPREIVSGTRLVFVFFFHEAVVRMAMDGAGALEEARSERVSRREKLAAPPVVGSPGRQVEVELDPNPEPEPEQVVEPEVATTPSPIILGGSSQSPDLHGSKEEARRAASKARLAKRLAERQQAAIKREEIAAASGWLDREPAMLPSLMQSAWEWAQAVQRRSVVALVPEPEPEPQADPDPETATGLALLAHHGLRIVKPPRVAPSMPVVGHEHAATLSSSYGGRNLEDAVTLHPADDWRSWCLIF